MTESIGAGGARVPLFKEQIARAVSGIHSEEALCISF